MTMKTGVMLGAPEGYTYNDRCVLNKNVYCKSLKPEAHLVMIQATGACDTELLTLSHFFTFCFHIYFQYKFLY